MYIHICRAAYFCVSGARYATPATLQEWMLSSRADVYLDIHLHIYICIYMHATLQEWMLSCPAQVFIFIYIYIHICISWMLLCTAQVCIKVYRLHKYMYICMHATLQEWMLSCPAQVFI